jgi:hypothetical protein
MGWALPLAILCSAAALILVVRAIAQALKSRADLFDRLNR